MEKNYKVVLWGCGLRTEDFIRYSWLKDCEIVGVVDKNSKKDNFFGYKVINSGLVTREFSESIDYIIISNQHFLEIMGECLSKGISIDKMVITENVIEPMLSDRYAPIKELAPELYKKQKEHRWALIKRCVIDTREHKSSMLDLKQYDYDIYRQDYFRFRTFELCAQRIIDCNIEGEIAELGVFQGDFSCLLNRKFQDRKLFLFDSFAGFDDKEAREAVKDGRISDDFSKMFSNTSVDIVRNRMLTKDNVHIYPGYFPTSVPSTLEQVKFAFVSIDVDLELSTYEGLAFFYPRLVEGGYIFIHDYQAISGIEQAIYRYINETGVSLKLVPLGDTSGTVVITK